MLGYKTKKELTVAVRAIVNQYEMYEEFQSEPISDLFATNHYYCKARGLRPIFFRKAWERDNPNYRFEAFFGEPIGWRRISWNKAIAGTTFEQHCIKSLRMYSRIETNSYRSRFPICQLCLVRPSVDTHHEQPTFKEVSKRCLQVITREDKEWILDQIFYDEGDSPALPETHPAVRLCILLHKSALMIAVCKQCHAKL